MLVTHVDDNIAINGILKNEIWHLKTDMKNSQSQVSLEITVPLQRNRLRLNRLDYIISLRLDKIHRHNNIYLLQSI